MKVLLVSLDAKQVHKALAPWCLKAYCDKYVNGCEISVGEYTINDSLGGIADDIFLKRPDVIGFSCYIWNISQVLRLANTMKKYLPGCVIVLGGPEVSFESNIDAFESADYLISGAGEIQFAKLLNRLIAGNPPQRTVIAADDSYIFEELPSPYTPEYFASFDKGEPYAMKNRLIYYESSRGCPFSCGYCLSGATSGIKYLPLDRVFSEIDLLLSHDAKCVKFVDRTFNADKDRAKAILALILAKDTCCTFHFEVAADLFDSETLEIISRMPMHRVQFEIGIQSVNGPTLHEINRKTNTDAVLKNAATLAGFGNCHVHIDLIAGLPYDTLDTFKLSVDRCLNAKPHMLQLGFLKLLKGSRLRENAPGYGYIFNDFPPYEIFKTGDMTFEDIITLKQIERLIDKYYNSGMFFNSVEYGIKKFGGGFDFFYALSLFLTDGCNIKISLKTAYSKLLSFLRTHCNPEESEHYVKLDCLTYDAKTALPDDIKSYRDKALENGIKKESGGRIKNIRSEFFPFDGITRTFVYDEKNPVTKAHTIIM